MPKDKSGETITITAKSYTDSDIETNSVETTLNILASIEPQIGNYEGIKICGDSI